jgi:hypothetical protein
MVQREVEKVAINWAVHIRRNRAIDRRLCSMSNRSNDLA